MQAILGFILKFILDYLFNKAQKEAQDAAARAAKEKERGETDAENIKRYEEAKERADQIAAATDLLNGTRTTR